MKIVCIGGGPAGLYFGLLMKLQDPANEVTVIERNRPYDTFGWGVVFSDATMQNLREADPVSAQTIGDAFNHWDDIDIHFKGRSIRSLSLIHICTFGFYFRERRLPDDFHHRLVDVCVYLCALALEREEARARIRQLAFYDELTGLPNRNLLLAQAEQAIARAEPERKRVAVLFLDLDRFKPVSYTHLEVYKRQPIPRRGRPRCRPATWCVVSAR